MKNLIYTLIFSFAAVVMQAQSHPDGYILLYRQNFSGDTAIKDFKFSNPDSWGIKKVKENRFLEFSGQSSYVPEFRSPGVLGIIKDHIFGDFILEADLMQTAGHEEVPDICIFFSVKDSTQFYFINLDSRPSDSTHGIFLVKNAPCYKVSDWQREGISWGAEKWHKVRIERSIVNRMVTVYFDDMQKAVMTATNPELVMGYLGFGSFSRSGRVDNIKVWAPTSIPEEALLFEGKSSP